MKIRDLIKKSSDSVVLLDVTIGNQPPFKVSIRGTGFIISEDGKFITCAHVYNELSDEERKLMGVKVPGKQDGKGVSHYNPYRIELLKIDKENDLALMQIVSNGNEKFFPINNNFFDSEAVEEGEEAVFIGYPLATELLAMGFGFTKVSNHCIISSVKRRGVDGSIHFFMVDTHVNNGSSGSPVFSRNNGRLIGVMNKKISQKIQLSDKKIIDIPSNLGCCVPAKYVENIINQ